LRIDPDRVFLGLDFHHLDERDVETLNISACGRQSDSRSFRLLALAAKEWRVENDGTLQSFGLSTESDPTAAVADVSRALTTSAPGYHV